MTVQLALDAALSNGTVAVLDGARVVAERAVPMKGVPSEQLLPAVLEALAEAGVAPRNLVRVICGAGPGSFTSLRVAAAIAKGFATGASATLAAVSSHALVLAGAPAGSVAAGRYLVITDALRAEWFASLVVVDANGEVVDVGLARRLSRDAVVRTAEAEQATLAGPGQALDLAPHARGVSRLLGRSGVVADVDLDAWEPDYGRLAEAQVKWEAAHGRPLHAPLRARLATAGDVAAVHAIESSSFGTPWRRAAFEALVVEPLVYFPVAEVDGTVAGFAVLMVAADEAEVTNIAVRSASRRAGVGAALLDEVIGEARRRGARTIYLDVRESNAAARALYASRAFETVGRRRRYYSSPVEDALSLRLVVAAAGSG